MRPSKRWSWVVWLVKVAAALPYLTQGHPGSAEKQEGAAASLMAAAPQGALTTL